MIAHVTTTAPRLAFRAAMSGLFDLLANTSQAARCAREAERLFAMSDEELLKRGLTRDRAIQYAFSPYLAI
jgi:hypothetical protein